MNDRAPRVLSLAGEPSGCALWRTFQPAAELQRRGYHAYWKYKDDPEVTTFEFSALVQSRLDAIVLPRLSWTDHAVGERFIRALHRAGLAVIYEMDDDFLSPAILARQKATTESYKTIDELEQNRQDRLHVLRQCDGVTVSSRRLASIAAQYVECPVEIVPNMIDTRWWRQRLRTARRIVPPLTIGWAGGARYREDLEPVAEAWSRIARRYPEVRFVVQGFMAEVLIHAVPKGRCSTLPWVPIEDYPCAMRNIDIGCASVAPKLFNTAKTPIKLWEFTLAGAVSVVSPTLYGAVGRDGEDCLMAETADEWEAALVRLVSSCELRRRLWRAQRRRVATEHSLERNWWRWLDAWTRIIDHYRAKPRLLLAS
jgi:glycosyltransferase involved in cell wall biosynthesis